MPYNALLQAHTMLSPPNYYVLALCAALVPTYSWIHTLSLAANGLEKFRQLANMIMPLLCPQLRMEGENFEPFHGA